MSRAVHEPLPPGANGRDACTELAVRGQDGDQAALERLLQELLPWMVFLARSVLRNDADAQEAAAEAALKFWQALPSFDPGRAGVRTFVRAIVINQAVSVARARHAAVSLDGYDVGSLRDDPAAAAESRDECEMLRRALAQIDPLEREALRLRYEDGLAYKQAAQALGTPQGTVASRVHRAKRALRARLRRGSEGGERRKAS